MTIKLLTDRIIALEFPIFKRNTIVKVLLKTKAKATIRRDLSLNGIIENKSANTTSVKDVHGVTHNCLLEHVYTSLESKPDVLGINKQIISLAMSLYYL